MYEDLVKDLRELSHEFYLDDSDDYTEGKLSEAADAIKQLSNAGSAYGRGWTLGYDAGREESKPNWIPVTERLPEDRVPVLATYIGFCTGEKNSDLLAVRFEGMWCYWDGDPCSYDKCNVDITHWMPIPSTEGLNET